MPQELQKYPDPIQGFDFIIGRGSKPTYRQRPIVGEENGQPLYGKVKLVKAEVVPEEIKAALLEEYERLSALRNEQNRRAAAEEAARKVEADAEAQPAEFDPEITQVDDVAFEEPADMPPSLGIIDDDMTAEERAILAAYDTGAPTPNTTLPSELDAAALQQRVEKLESMLKDMIAGSVYEADAFLLAEQLSERFGVYTILLQREPSDRDIHPITGEIMTGFERGLAYKQYVKATVNNSLSQFGKTVQAAMQAPRHEQPMPQAVAPLPANYQTLQSHLDRESSAEDRQLAGDTVNHPPINRRRPIIDGSWLTKAKSIDDFDLEEL